MSKNILGLKELTEAVSKAAAIRLRLELEPVAGKGEKIFPPTYKGGTYAIEDRVDSNGEIEKCVTIDSVQSQANRFEECLQKAIDEGAITLPIIEIDLESLKSKDGEGRITTLTAPHRWADAYFIYSQDDKKKKFRDTEIGIALSEALPKNATVLFQYCPTSLLFGVWDSHKAKGATGTKFERCLASEIVAYGIEEGTRFASKGDPMVSSNADKFKGQEASKLGFGMIPPTDTHGGITSKTIRQVSLISLTGLRKLRFPLNGKSDMETDNAARTVLAALGLFALTDLFHRGYSLRSGCSLRSSEKELTFEIVSNGGERSFTLDKESATSLFMDAVEQSKKAKLPWETKPKTFYATEELKKWILAAQKQDKEGKNDNKKEGD